MDPNDFFREAILQICGHLEVEKALVSSLNFLRREMPVDRMILQFFEGEQNAVRTVAIATPRKGEVVDLLMPLSPEARREMSAFEREYKKQKSNYVWLFKDIPQNQRMTLEISDFHGINITSLLVMPLGVLKNLVGGGSLLLIAEGAGKFTQEHADLLSSIRLPCAIAMSNALKHRNELKLHDRDFFWEVTTRICGNLKIEDGMHACLQLLRQHMPADSLYLERYEEALSAMRFVARADAECGESMDLLVSLSEDAKTAINMGPSDALVEMGPSVYVANQPDEEPITKCLLSALKIPPSSVMSVPLRVGDLFVGAIVLLAKGTDRFNKQHARLFSNFKIPFFVAMSNTLKHREILKLQELLAEENRYLHGELRRLSGGEMVGANFGLKDVMFKAHQVAVMNSPVLLLGETGVGKDLIANAVHDCSPRSSGPFVSVNCGAIPEALIDSELFGHEKGAFTGALARKKGRFERADKGTIFLDEIGELPPQAQVRLLRVLQNKEIERVGGIKTIPLDIRIIAATNRNLENMVEKGEFREDLWFRINVFPIWIPPLRDRISDIPALVQHFINSKSKELKLPAIPSLSPGVMDVLMQYHWPGNVRELQNIIERALILNPMGPLVIENFSIAVTKKSARFSEKIQGTDNLDEMISNHIKHVLAKTKGKVNGKNGAAALLGINPSTLRNRMKKLGIDYGRGAINPNRQR